MDNEDTTMADWQSLYNARFGTVAPDATPSADAISSVKSLLNRRSIRRYRNETLDPALVELLLACAQSAPAKSDLQQYSIIRVSNARTKAAISTLIKSMPWIETSPEFYIFCGDVRRNRRIAELRGFDYSNDNVDTFMNAAVDAGIAMTMMINAAEAIGLGCCPISAVRNHNEDIARLLNLPQGVFSVAGLTVGWPEAPGYMSLRLGSDIVVHDDQYDDADLAEHLDRYDSERKRRYQIPPEKQRHADRYGVNPECTWSENVARQLSVPEREEFGDWLSAQGIHLD